MKLKLTINRHTTDSELIHLSTFLGALALNRGGAVAVGEPVVGYVMAEDVADPTPDETVHVSVAGTEAPRRRRRTRAEIDAAAAAAAAAAEPVAAAAAEPVAATAAEPVVAEPASGNDQPAPTPAAPETATPTATEAAPAAAATASPSEPAPGEKVATHADAQQLATTQARKHGPDKVKALIAEFPGASRIADLGQGDIATFIQKLHALDG